MKRLVSKGILLLVYFFVLFFVLCGCSIENEYCNNEEQSDDNFNVEKKSSEQTNDSEDAFDFTLSESDITNELVLADDYLSSILYVSTEWLPGKYVVIGKDGEGDQCCGILDNNGYFKELVDYTVIYPLKNGKLLATDDREAPITFDLAEYEELSLNMATVSGRIIDEYGNVVFDYKDGFARMIPAGSKSVIVFVASSSLEGILLQWGELNYDGEWITPLNTDLVASCFLDAVVMDNDGYHWNFEEFTYDSKEYIEYKNYVFSDAGLSDEEGGVLQFTRKIWRDQSGLGRFGGFGYVYNARFGMMIELPICVYLKEVSNHSYMGDYLYNLFGLNMYYQLNETEIYPDSLEYSYIKYVDSIFENGEWIPYFSSILDEKHELFNIYGEKISFDSQITNYFSKFQGFFDNRIIILLTGADNGKYLTVADFEGNTIIEPIFLKNVERVEGLCGKYFFYICEDGSLCAVNVENGNVSRSAECNRGTSLYIEKLKKINNDKIALCWIDEDYNMWYEIYQIEDTVIKKIY